MKTVGDDIWRSPRPEECCEHVPWQSARLANGNSNTQDLGLDTRRPCGTQRSPMFGARHAEETVSSNVGSQ